MGGTEAAGSERAFDPEHSPSQLSPVPTIVQQQPMQLSKQRLKTPTSRPPGDPPFPTCFDRPSFGLLRPPQCSSVAPTHWRALPICAPNQSFGRICKQPLHTYTRVSNRLHASQSARPTPGARLPDIPGKSELANRPEPQRFETTDRETCSARVWLCRRRRRRGAAGGRGDGTGQK